MGAVKTRQEAQVSVFPILGSTRNCSYVQAFNIAPHPNAVSYRQVSSIRALGTHTQEKPSGFSPSGCNSSSILCPASGGSGVTPRFTKIVSAMSQLNDFPWSKPMSELVKRGQGKEALRIYREIRENGVTPKTHTFVAALKACTSIPDLEAGKEIHSHVIETGDSTNIFVANALLHMYVKCGNLEDAKYVFETMPHRDVVAWTTIIMGYAQKEAGGLALQLFSSMQNEGVAPSERTFVAALKACASLAAQGGSKEMDGELVKKRCLERGRDLHYQIVKSGFESNVFIANTLVDMYAKCGSMVDAREVFEKMPYPNVVSYTAMIMGYAQMEARELALQLYAQMQADGVTPNARTFVAVLKACCSMPAQEEGEHGDYELLRIDCLEKGRAIHSEIIKSGSESDIFVANTLVHMYAKCGSMMDARSVFERMCHRDVVSWNAIIMGYAQEKMGELALQLYVRMQDEGVTPNACTFVAALKGCCSLAAQGEDKQVDELMKTKCLEKGRAIHSQIAKSGFESNIFISNTLVGLYVKCGSMIDAHQIFERMPHRDLLSWYTMIMGYGLKEMWESVLQLYERMQHEGFVPDARLFTAALRACGNLAEQEEGKLIDGERVRVRCLKNGRFIHSQVAKSGHEANALVANSLVDMYAKCGSMVDASQVFEIMQHPNVMSWTAMIMGYAQKGAGELALHFYARMQHEGVTPNAHIFVAALKACSSLIAHEQGKQGDPELVKLACLNKVRAIHSQVLKSGFDSDIFVANALVGVYVKCGSMVNACQVFERMPHRNVVSWSTMIMGYAQEGEEELALELYAQMQCESCTPNAYTFVAALMACGSLAAQEEGKQFNGELVKIGCLEKGRGIHSQIAKSGLESDLFVSSTLVDTYAKCGSMVDARKVFERMPHHDVVSWTAIIMGYAQKEEGEVALQLYARMQYEGFTPDAYTFVAVLMACGSMVSLEAGKKIHAEICRVGLEDHAFIAACLIDMYGKCGSMADAQRLVDTSHTRDAVKWSALIAGYSRQGDSKNVFDLFERMQQEGIRPISSIFASILTVCSHTGLVDKGQKYFQTMYSDYEIVPATEHFNCMVDLLGRAGQLDESVAMAKKIPFKPDVVTWTAILGGCRKWNNVEVGRCAFECAMRVDEKQAAVYVLMMSIYVSAHMWEECAKIQAMRRNAQSLEEGRMAPVD